MLIYDRHIDEVMPTDRVNETMPFDLSRHKLSNHHVAKKMFERFDREMKLYAQMRNERPRPVLKTLRDEDVRRIVADDAAARDAACAAVQQILAELRELHERDTDFVARTRRRVIEKANEVSFDEGERITEQRRYWLLRFAQREARLWFEHLCSGLLSPDAERDF